MALPTLVYIRSNVQASDLAPLMQRAFVMELAARIVLPVKKDGQLASRAQQLAMAARMEALAAEENKRQRMAVPYVSEAELARWGAGL